MPRLFSDNRTLPFRALQIWQILVGKAHERQTITYGRLAHLLDYGGAFVLANPLDYVSCYCLHHKLPVLTAIVINQDTKLPGFGIPADDPIGEQERVLQYNWYNLIPPTPEEFAKAHRAVRGK